MIAFVFTSKRFGAIVFYRSSFVPLPPPTTRVCGSGHLTRNAFKVHELCLPVFI